MWLFRDKLLPLHSDLRKSIASAFVQGEGETDKTTALGLRAGMAQMDK